MAVAQDGEATSVDRTSSSTRTLSHTSAGSNRVAIVTMCVLDGAGLQATYPQYGGLSMTEVTTGPTIAGISGRVRMFYIINPPTGSTTININFDASTNGPIGVSSYNGVDTSNPIRGHNQATGTDTTPTVVVSSAVGDMVVDAVSLAQLLTNAGADQTENYQSLGGGDDHGSSYEVGAASVTMSWTGGSANWAILAASLRAFGGGGGGDLNVLIGEPITGSSVLN